MKKIHCLNPIAACGTDLFPADYEMTDNKAEADAFLVRSASMHEMELPEGLLADPGITPAELERKRVALGLDQPVIIQYFTWLKQLLTGNL